MRFLHLFVMFFFLSVSMMTMIVVVQSSPTPSIRSTIVSKVIGPELDEMRQHLQIVPEIRSHMNEVIAVVHDIRDLLRKVATFDKKSFFALASK